MLASASYEIFLVQMAYYSVFNIQVLGFLGNKNIQIIVWFALAFVASIIGGMLLYRIEGKTR